MIFDNTKLCPQFPANPDRCKVNPFETMENDVLTCAEKILVILAPASEFAGFN